MIGRVTDGEIAYLTPEARARVEIDAKLASAGWAVQHAGKVNLAASRGVAVREFVLADPYGRVDYLLFVDGQPVGVIEAKKAGSTLTGVEWQTKKYLEGVPESIAMPIEPLPFAYQSTGVETRFTNALDPDAASREVFWLHRPETLAGWVEDYFRRPTSRACGRRRTSPSATSSARSPRTGRAR